MKLNEISTAQALKIAESKEYENWSDYQKVRFQLFTDKLSMPFEVFHEAITKVLGRDVYTHEFGMNLEGLILEFLGEKQAPTLEEIINMIPEDKRIIIQP